MLGMTFARGMQQRAKKKSTALWPMILVALLCTSAFSQQAPKASDRETLWSAWVAKVLDGEKEAESFDGSRCDVLTPYLAIEVEWVSKWEEAIGQSVFYAIQHNRQPGIVLLGKTMDNKEQEDGLRCQLVCQRLNISLVVVDATESKQKVKEQLLEFAKKAQTVAKY